MIPEDRRGWGKSTSQKLHPKNADFFDLDRHDPRNKFSGKLGDVPWTQRRGLNVGIGKDFGRESLDAGAFTPRIVWQTGFAAGLLEKSYAVPGMFNWDLGQQ